MTSSKVDWRISLIMLTLSCFRTSHGCLNDGTVLYCSGAGLTSFVTDVDATIETVDLSNNRIQVIPHVELPALVENLNLSNNFITNITRGAFSNVASGLLSLDLSFNSLNVKLLENITHGMENSGLETFYIEGNAFYHINASAFGTMDIDKLLDISNCQIQTIEDNTFTYMNSLEILNISHNDLQEIPQGVFHGLEGLETLDLSFNRLSTIEDHMFIHLDTSVRSIDLSFNLISHIRTKSFENLVELRNLSLEGNRLTSFPHEQLSVLNSLFRLDMSRNPIDVIVTPNLTVNSPLKVLHMHQMKKLLSIEEQGLWNFVEIEQLYVTHNYRMYHISDLFGEGGAQFLRIVDLSNNSLTTMARNVLPWRRLRTVSLAGNPWTCDCNVGWMKNVTDYYLKPLNVECKLPLNLRGHKIGDISKAELTCGQQQKTIVWYRDPPKAIFLGTLVGVLLLMMVISALLMVKYKDKLPCAKKVHGKYVMVYTQDADEAYLKIESPDQKTPLTESVDV